MQQSRFTDEQIVVMLRGANRTSVLAKLRSRSIIVSGWPLQLEECGLKCNCFRGGSIPGDALNAKCLPISSQNASQAHAGFGTDFVLSTGPHACTSRKVRKGAAVLSERVMWVLQP